MNSIFVPTVIDRLSRKLPGLVFYVLSVPAPTTQHLEVLHERSVDLIVIWLAAPFEHDDVKVEFLYSDAITVVAAPDSKWVRRRKIDFAELVDEPWCLPTKDTPAASAIARAFRERGLAPAAEFRDHEFDSTAPLIDCNRPRSCLRIQNEAPT